ncbi:MAG TPA: hypothetical protein VG604_00150 [Candidatus Saccharimonadales bacterium]|nr:hypothetical protein [Candidatus Saccharimonadales bacterium]
MKSKKGLRFGASTLVSVISLLAFGAPAAFATPDTCTWTGATDDKFSTATNWNNCSSAAPVTGDNLVFDNTSLSTTNLLDDISSGSVVFGDITFEGTGTSAFDITPDTGISLATSGNITDTTTNGVDIDMPVTFSGATPTVSTASFMQFGDVSTPMTMATGANDITFSITGSAAGAEIDNYEVFTGTGSITFDNTGDNGTFVQYAASPAYTGSVHVTGGVIDLFATGTTSPDYFSGSAGITVDSGATVEFDNVTAATASVAEALTVAGVGSAQCTSLFTSATVHCGAVLGNLASGSNLTLAGPITMTADTQFNDNDTITITGALAGTGFKATNAVGKLVVSASSNSSGTPNGTYNATGNLQGGGGSGNGSGGSGSGSSSTTSAPGTPDTGLGAIVGKPFGVLAITAAAAGSMLIAAKQLKFVKN